MREVTDLATIVEVEPEDVFEKVKGRALSKVREVLIDTYAQNMMIRLTTESKPLLLGSEEVEG